MKTDFKSLKKELNKLTDIDYLKKEINRVANDVKSFDVQSRLSPEAKERMAKLEKRFEVLIAKLQQLQKQVDTNLEYVLSFVRSGNKTSTVRRGQSSKVAKKTTKKKAVRKTSKKAAAKVD